MSARSRIYPFLCLLLLMALPARPAAAQQFEVKTHTLKNGMKVLVQEDDSIPNVALYIFYRIGSRNEVPGTTGLSHYFEHMMFNGAKKYGPGEFDRMMEAAGGSNNAYTTRDVTVYQDWFPSEKLDVILDLEADRIANLGFDPKVVESERGVVASERRLRMENSNEGILWEQLWATAYIAHPYQWPVVGWMSDIESWTIADLKKHFRMGYSPSNATMVVVGAVKAEDVFQRVEESIGGIESHEPPPPVRTVEPEQRGERRAEVRKPAQLPLLMIAYHVPKSDHPDYWALQVLQTILFDGESSRMYRSIVDEQQLALGVDSNVPFAMDPTLLVIDSQPREGVDTAKLEKAIYQELEKVQSTPVTDQELEKAKNMLLAQFYRQMKSINGKANAIGTFEVFFGDYHKLFDAAQEFENVSREDVMRVAKQYLQEKNRTVATLIPAKGDESKNAEADHE